MAWMGWWIWIWLIYDTDPTMQLLRTPGGPGSISRGCGLRAPRMMVATCGSRGAANVYIQMSK